MTLRILWVALVLWASLVARPALAWSGHALCTWPALEAMPELAARTVRAESLEQFLAAQGAALERVLADHEAWARGHLQPYAPRPDALAYSAAPAEGQRARWLKALRLNVSSRLPLFVQLRPGDAAPGRARLAWSEVTSLASGRGARDNHFAALAEGETVSAIDVLATASAEPDYGLDLGLFADNDTAHGQANGFGRQPFGNAKVDYGTQAPFHMGFFHEARIVFAAAGFLRRTHPEERTALFLALARHAFASGHPYWGYRFTGWALHYVQDLTQPYHARALPGVGAARMIGINTVSLVGVQGPKNDAIALVSNRHTAVENYQFRRLVHAYEDGRMDDPLLAALRDPRGDRERAAFEVPQMRGLISREAFDAADALDAQLERSFPGRYTADPTVTLGNESDALDMSRVAIVHSAAEEAQLERLVAQRLTRLGVHTRALLRAVLPR